MEPAKRALLAVTAVVAGVAISSFFNGLVSAILLFARQYEVSQFIFWTMGGLEGRTWRQVLLAFPAAGLPNDGRSVDWRGDLCILPLDAVAAPAAGRSAGRAG